MTLSLAILSSDASVRRTTNPAFSSRMRAASKFIPRTSVTLTSGAPGRLLGRGRAASGRRRGEHAGAVADGALGARRLHGAGDVRLGPSEHRLGCDRATLAEPEEVGAQLIGGRVPVGRVLGQGLQH